MLKYNSFKTKETNHVTRRGKFMTLTKQLYSDNLTLDITINWEMELIHENKHYLAVWAKKQSRKTKEYQYSLDIFLLENNQPTLLSKKDKTASSAIAAVTAFQQANIQSEFSYSLAELKENRLNIFDNFEAVVENIFKRSQVGEFLGQQNTNLCIQDVADILGFSFPVIHASVVKLEAQHKLGIKGNILVPWAVRKRHMEQGLILTGHKDYDSSEIGGFWWCRACGQGGDLKTLQPKNVPCIT
jgi:hypothetical protein